MLDSIIILEEALCAEVHEPAGVTHGHGRAFENARRDVYVDAGWSPRV